MRTVSVPWLIATLEMRTSWPMTIVPVRSSTTTRAGVSDSTIRFSSSATKRAAEMPSGLCRMTVRESCSLATRLPKRSCAYALMTSAIITAVEKSALRSCSVIDAEVGEFAVHLPLDDGAVGNAAGCRHALRQRLGLPLGGKAGDEDRALRDRVDLSVGGLQRRHDQRAAVERGGVAERGDADVDAGAGFDKGGQVGGDDHGRDVLGARPAAFQRDAEILQHRADRLLGVGRVAQAVAAALQADDEAVADQLVVARALQHGDVLDARDRSGIGRDHAAAMVPPSLSPPPLLPPPRH